MLKPFAKFTISSRAWARHDFIKELKMKAFSFLMSNGEKVYIAQKEVTAKKLFIREQEAFMTEYPEDVPDNFPKNWRDKIKVFNVSAGRAEITFIVNEYAHTLQLTDRQYNTKIENLEKFIKGYGYYKIHLSYY